MPSLRSQEHKGQTAATLRRASQYDKFYIPFLQNLVEKVYTPIYGLFPDKPTKIEGLQSFMQQDHPKFYEDFWGDRNLEFADSFEDVLDKIRLSQYTNVLCLMDLSYTFPYNLKLSPLAFAISFYNFKLEKLTEKQPKGLEGQNIKAPLTKITYICFTGYYSEIDIDVLTKFSQDVQIIMIYLNTTGGPVLDNKNTESSRDELDARVLLKRKNVITISKNILLLPLDASEETINSDYIYELFDVIVTPAIKRFETEIVCVNYPISFHKESGFALKPSTWSKILYNICLAANYNVVLCPHRIFVPEERDTIDNEAIQMFVADILPKFSRAPDWDYFQECFTRSLHVLSSKFL